MTDLTTHLLPGTLRSVDDDMGEFAQQIADAAESFLLSLREISHEESAAAVVPLLLVEVSQVLLAGARLGALRDVEPVEEFQPDVGPDPDLDALRLRLARLFDNVDTYSYNFDPYVPDIVLGQLSDDLTTVAADVANGLRHFRHGDVDEALWWWQFSYVSSWGTLASALLRALQSIVTHDRLDTEVVGEAEQIAAAEALDSPDPVA